MATSDNSSLADELGITAGMAVSIFNSPNYFELDLGELPEDVEVHRDSEDSPADLFLIFADRSDEAERGFERAVTNMSRDGVIWFAWSKEPSDRNSDIDDQTLRELFEPHGMAADGSVSIDETWQGLRFTVAEGASWPPDDDARG
ncbi:MAG TPA: hypothetical protein VFT85_07630 [Acidimicrobiia bacterium]|nr:hypothetical protein [Acidimicrobiia bacterium]